MKKILAVVVALFSLSTSPVGAQSTVKWEDVCWAIDRDPNVDALDVSRFLAQFGRSIFDNPCPLYGWAPIPVTGQTVSVQPGDDASSQVGLPIPNWLSNDPSTYRFINNGDGTVTDHLTGLVWLEWSSCGSQMSWTDALNDVSEIENGADCGNPGTWALTDGSSPGDWRLPNINELRSLINYAYKNPALANAKEDGQHTSGDPFVAVQNDNYWTSSYDAGAPGTSAWVLDMGTGASSPVSTPTLPLPPPQIWPCKAGIVDPDI